MKSRIVLGAAVVIALLGLAPAAAHATDPVDLAGAYVLDESGVVSGDEARIKTALDQLYADTSMQLFVVYVDSFTGADSAADWANTSAELSGLGPSDALLAVATDDRQYYVSVADDFPLSDDDLSEIVDNTLIPQLRDDNWADAAVDFAGGLRGEGNDSGSLPLWPIVLILVVAVGGALVYLLVRAARRRAAGEKDLPSGEPTQKALDQRAATLLVEVDDSLRTSEQELGFAVAQFGEDATREFAATLASAKTAVAEAFSIRQKLDDAFAESAADKRALTLRLIELASTADADLDAQADAFDALRELEKNAPRILDEVDVAAQALDARLAATEATTQQLATRYAPTTIATIVQNAAQARTLLALAATTATTARAALAGGKTSAATVTVRAAQSSVAQATQLLDAVDTLAAELGRAQTALGAAIDELERDIAEARAAAGSGASSALAAAVDAASAGLAAVRPDSDRTPVDSLQRVERLDEALASALTTVRDQQQREASARSSLERVMASARTQISAGEQYLSTRRGGVGTDARTRLSAAQQALDEAAALAGPDPVAALTAAHRAASLAQQGTELAQGDVDYFSRSNAGSGGIGGSMGGMGGGIDTGALLGGILGGLLSGGGGGGWGGGSSWSGGRSSGGSRGSSGGSGGGGFGGSSRRSSGGGSRGGRRGGGGRF